MEIFLENDFRKLKKSLLKVHKSESLNSKLARFSTILILLGFIKLLGQSCNIVVSKFIFHLKTVKVISVHSCSRKLQSIGKSMPMKVSFSLQCCKEFNDLTSTRSLISLRHSNYLFTRLLIAETEFREIKGRMQNKTLCYRTKRNRFSINKRMLILTFHVMKQFTKTIFRLILPS